MKLSLNYEDHVKWLRDNVSEDTVIDPNWFDYLYDTPTLFHLFIATGQTSYKDILGLYEGYKINEMLNVVQAEMHEAYYDRG